MACRVNSLPCEPGILSSILGTHIKSDMGGYRDRRIKVAGPASIGYTGKQGSLT